MPVPAFCKYRHRTRSQIRDQILDLIAIYDHALIFFLSNLRVPSAGWRIREIPNRASSPKIHYQVATGHRRANIPLRRCVHKNGQRLNYDTQASDKASACCNTNSTARASWSGGYLYFRKMRLTINRSFARTVSRANSGHREH
jgi:hypothetical protein